MAAALSDWLVALAPSVFFALVDGSGTPVGDCSPCSADVGKLTPVECKNLLKIRVKLQWCCG